MSIFERIRQINMKMQDIQVKFGALDEQAQQTPTTLTTGANFSSILNSIQEIEGIDNLVEIRNSDIEGFSKYIDEAAQAYNLEPALIKAVIHQESGFNPKAVSKVGARGLMQLMPGTADSLGVIDSFDPRENILGGSRYLKGLLEHFGGDISLALAAYNAGPGSVEKYRGIPPYRETQNYVKSVLALYERYNKK